jgi:hypothetical protein
MATPLKATYNVSNAFTGLSELQAADTFNLSNVAVFGKAIQETKNAIAANAIDLSLGSIFTKTITAATTFTVSNVPTTGTVASFILELTNGSAFTITWWKGPLNENIKWASGTAPTLTSSGKDILGFYTHDGGTTWNGLVLAKDVR